MRLLPHWGWHNVAANSLRPSLFGPLLRKIYERADERLRSSRRIEALAWYARRAEDELSFAGSLAPELWQEASDFAARVEADVLPAIRRDRPELSGAADMRLLYFLVRYARPVCALETGVAAGFSSLAILSAMRVNGLGVLYSSDLPYVRSHGAGSDIGCVVPDHLRRNWRLFVRGDAANMKRILPAVETIDFVHYDSDKTYVGRRLVCEAIRAKLSDRALFMMDDVQDNGFFRDFAERQDRRFRVFAAQTKFVGLIGI
jgi:predicted O-methyltransferase YrrM